MPLGCLTASLSNCGLRGKGPCEEAYTMTHVPLSQGFLLEPAWFQPLNTSGFGNDSKKQETPNHHRDVASSSPSPIAPSVRH